MNTYVIAKKIVSYLENSSDKRIVDGFFYLFDPCPVQYTDYTEAVLKAESLSKVQTGTEYVVFTQVAGVRMDVQYSRTQVEYNGV